MMEEPPVAGPSHAYPTPDDWRVTRQTLSDWTYKVLFLALAGGLIIYALLAAQDQPYLPGEAQACLGFLNQFLHADTWADKVAVLGQSDGAGFNLVLRLKHLVWLGLTGHFSFYLAVVINTSLLILLAYELFRLAGLSLPGYLLLATGLLLMAPCNPALWLSGYGGRQALGYLLALWGFAALFDKADDNGLWKATAWLALAASTSECMAMAIPIGAVLYLAQRYAAGARQRLDTDFVWSAIFATVILADGQIAQALGLRMGATSLGLKASVLIALLLIKLWVWTRPRIKPAIAEAFCLSLCLGVAVVGVGTFYARRPAIARQYAQTQQNPGTTDDRQAVATATALRYWHPPAASTEAGR